MCEVPLSLWRHLTHQRSHNRAARCVRCHCLFGGTSHINAAIIERRNVWGAAKVIVVSAWNAGTGAGAAQQGPAPTPNYQGCCCWCGILLSKKTAPQCQGCCCCGAIDLAATDKQLLAWKRLHCTAVTSKWCRCKTATLKTLLVLTVREVFFQLISSDGIVCRKQQRTHHNEKNNRNTYYFGGKKRRSTYFFF